MTYFYRYETLAQLTKWNRAAKYTISGQSTTWLDTGMASFIFKSWLIGYPDDADRENLMRYDFILEQKQSGLIESQLRIYIPTTAWIFKDDTS